MKKNQVVLDKLSKSVISLQKLNANNGSKQRQEKLFESIRTQSLLEIYTSPVITNLITEEELSGFLLYLNERLHPIVLAYRPERGSYIKYLIQSAAFRALNYISKKVKLAKLDFALSQYVYVEEKALTYNNDWLKVAEEKTMSGNEDLIKILRYMCAKRQSYQRKIFIYLAGIHPCLTPDLIENICINLNFDIDQTLKIFERIYESSIKPDSVSTRMRLKDRRNKNWAYLLYTENEIEYANLTGSARKQMTLEKQANKFKIRNKTANTKMEVLKNNISYSVVAKELNIPLGTVSSTAYFVKNLLESIGSDERYVQLGRPADVVLPRFEPFLAFGLEDGKEEDRAKEDGEESC